MEPSQPAGEGGAGRGSGEVEGVILKFRAGTGPSEWGLELEQGLGMPCIEAWRGIQEGTSDQQACKYLKFLTTSSIALGAPRLGVGSVPTGW